MNVSALQDKHFSNYEIENTMKFKANFCAYWRMTMINMLRIGFAIAVVVGLIGTILYGIFSFGVAAYANIAIMYTAISAIGFFATIFVITFFFYNLSEKKNRKERAIARGEYSKPEYGLFKTKYLSWKKKICPVVEYK